MTRPGTIQMRRGSWYIFTSFPGFRPARQALDGRFIASLIRKYFSVYDGTLLSSRALGYWVPQLRDGNLRVVRNDMKLRLANMEEGTLKRKVVEWHGWLNTMCMVRYSAPNTNKGKAVS
jgi:hypothetical protein